MEKTLLANDCAEILGAIENAVINDAIETDDEDNPQIPAKYRVTENPFGLPNRNVFATPSKRKYKVKKIVSIENPKTPKSYRLKNNRLDRQWYFTGNSINLLNAISLGDGKNNVFTVFGRNANGWYCPNIPVAFIADGHIVKLADNPFERYCNLIAKKWILFRDWVPTYRYDIEDLQLIVGEVVFTELSNDTPVEEINAIAYRRLDAEYRAFPNYKTEPKSEILTIELRGLFGELFCDSISELPPVTDMNGNAMSLEPELNWKANLSDKELARFVQLKALFDRARENHHFAPIQTWKCGLYYALGVETDKAIRLIYGEPKGKKKARSNKNTYFAHAMDVLNWVKEAVKESDPKLWSKWRKAMETEQLVNSCNELLANLLKTNKLTLDRDGVARIKSFIAAEPAKALEYLRAIK